MNSKDNTLEYYTRNAAAFADGTINVGFSALQNEFVSYLAPAGRILDLGCGSGRDSKAFIQMGFDVVAMDGSAELCRMASDFIGQEVVCSTFQEYEPVGLFDGIWACASLLHLKREEIPGVIQKYGVVLVPDGVFYASFKYGDFEGERNGRFFTDMNERTFAHIIENISYLTLIKQSISEDVRPGRSNEKWFNAFLRRET